MMKKIIAVQIMLFMLGTVISCNKSSDVSIMNSHSSLVELYHDWRAFQGDLFTD